MLRPARRGAGPPWTAVGPILLGSSTEDDEDEGEDECEAEDMDGILPVVADEAEAIVLLTTAEGGDDDKDAAEVEAG